MSANPENIAELLRRYRTHNEWGDQEHHTICDEAADFIDELSERIKILEDLREADAIHSGGMRRHADTIEAKLVSLSKENEQLRMKLTPANSGSGTVHHIDRLADAIHLLDEASGFAAVSPAGRDNIEQVSDMFPEIVEQAYRVGFVDGEKHATECYGFELQPARLQNEWLKDKLTDILLPPNSQKNNEEFLIELGMPIAGEHR